MRAGYRTIIDHYEACLAQHGDSHLGVDWPNAADAENRYRVMLELIRRPHDGRISLMDFGCGSGHLYEHMLRAGYNDIHYIGVDASPRFIELSRRKFTDTAFYCC